MKKLLSMVLLIVMVTTLFVGCGNKGEDSKVESKGATTTDSASASNDKEKAKSVDDTKTISGEITVITQRTDLVDTKFKDYVEQFKGRYPDVEVKFEAITNYENDIAIRLGTEEYGDVLMLPNVVPSNEFADYFEPLGTVDELSAKYKKEFLTAKISDGIVYGLASNANAQGIVYNKKVFANAGITELPKTPEEFLEALRKIKENTDAIPYYTNFAAGWTLTAWEDHAWGSITGDADYHNNKIVHEPDPFSEGKPHYTLYKLMYDIVKQGLCEEDPVTTDWEKSKVMINNGEIGSMLLGSWAISQMQGAGEHPEDIGYMAFPYNIDGKQYATAGADYCYAINVHSKNKDAARAWIDFMINDSGFALSEGSMSIVKDSPLPDTLKDFTNVIMIVDNPATPENDGLFDKISNESEVALYAEKEKRRIIEAAMGSTNETFDDIMNDWNARWAQTQKDLGVEIQ